MCGAAQEHRKYSQYFIITINGVSVLKTCESPCCTAETNAILYGSYTSILLLFSRSVMSNSLQPRGLQHARPLSITNSWSLLKLMSIESVMPSNHLILCRPLLLPPSIFPSIWVFSSDSVLPIRWPEYWSFSFSISPSSEYSGLIPFRMDWLDLLAAQGTLKSLLQRHSSKASILQRSAFFVVQLSHPYVTSGKTTDLTVRTFVGKGGAFVDRGAWRATVHGVTKSWTRLKWVSTCKNLPSIIMDRAGYSSWGHKESDTTEQLTVSHSLQVNSLKWVWSQIMMTVRKYLDTGTDFWGILKCFRDFPARSVVRTSPSKAMGAGSIPG